MDTQISGYISIKRRFLIIQIAFILKEIGQLGRALQNDFFYSFTNYLR